MDISNVAHRNRCQKVREYFLLHRRRVPGGDIRRPRDKERNSEISPKSTADFSQKRQQTRRRPEVAQKVHLGAQIHRIFNVYRLVASLATPRYHHLRLQTPTGPQNGLEKLVKERFRGAISRNIPLGK